MPDIPPPPPPIEAADVAELLKHFSDPTGRAVEASADGLVTVRVGASFTVRSIEFTDRDLDPKVRQRLEAATLTAINEALQKAALAAGEVLAAFDASKQRDRAAAR